MTQINIENNTPYHRRVFLHPSELSADAPVPLMLAAWKHFDLGPGESAGTAVGSVRIGARVANGSEFDHRTVVADVNYGDVWTLGATNGILTLTGPIGAGPENEIRVINALDGPNAPAVHVTLYWDYAPWLGFDAQPQRIVAFTPMNQLYAYASKPIVDGSSALVMEPVYDRIRFTDPGVRLKLSPSPDGATVQWTMGAGDKLQ